jgi:hypothetical protein
MFNEIVARAVVAERLAAANEAARVRRMIVAAGRKPAKSGRGGWLVLLRPRASPALPASSSG